MGVRERWISLLHRAATGTRKTRTLLTPVGVAVFGAFTALFVFAAIIADGLLHVNLPGAWATSTLSIAGRPRCSSRGSGRDRILPPRSIHTTLVCRAKLPPSPGDALPGRGEERHVHRTHPGQDRW